MKKGDRVKFDYLGDEHTGIIVDITSSLIASRSHDVVHIKLEHYAMLVTINTTLFPERIRQVTEHEN